MFQKYTHNIYNQDDTKMNFHDWNLKGANTMTVP